MIDDEAHIRKVIETKLKNWGYEVATADNGKTGLEHIMEEHPDAVIMDINVPKIDGKKLCMMTNVLKKNRSFLTIVITARIASDEKIWVNEMKDTLFMEKPFSPAKILEGLDTYFNIKR